MSSKSAIRFSFVFYLMYKIAVSLPEEQYTGDLKDDSLYSMAPYQPKKMVTQMWNMKNSNVNEETYDYDPVKDPEREERRQQKKERRQQERKVKKEERRRNRYRLNNQKAVAIPNEENPTYNMNYHNDHLDALSTTDAMADTIIVQKNNLESVQNMAWLASNLTSIWSILYQMQKDIKQIRRNYRPSNQNKFQVISETPPVATYEIPDVCDPLYEIDPNACIDSHGSICGGRGKCSCGQCICEAPHYGIHCHCNDLDCNYHGGVQCGGAGRGQCRCGSCVCRPEFMGSACECSTSTAACKTPEKEICAGKGKCICNRCQCEDGFAGKFCEESIYSASMCERLKPCVLCQAFGRQYPQCEDCNIKFQFVDELESSRSTCLMTNLGCILMYSYTSPANADGSINVFVQKDMSCPTS